MQQNIHQVGAPMIPVPQQLTLSPSEPAHVYDQSVLRNQQIQQEIPHMQTRHKRASADISIDASMSLTTPQATPERRTRTRSKKASIDSQQVEVPQQVPPVENSQPEIIQPTPIPTSVEKEQIVNNNAIISNNNATINNNNATTNNNNATITNNNDNNAEVNPIVSKSNQEEYKDRENIRDEREASRSPSVGSSSAKSESVIKEIPLSGERHRLSRSKSPKSRWHHSPSPQQQIHSSSTIEEEQSSVTASPNDDNKYVLYIIVFDV